MTTHAPNGYRTLCGKLNDGDRIASLGDDGWSAVTCPECRRTVLTLGTNADPLRSTLRPPEADDG